MFELLLLLGIGGIICIAIYFNQVIIGWILLAAIISFMTNRPIFFHTPMNLWNRESKSPPEKKWPKSTNRSNI